MKSLKDLLIGINVEELIGMNDKLMISTIAFDSRKVEENTLFVAIKGTQSDGHEYIQKALESGAQAIVCETIPKDLRTDYPIVVVKNTQQTLGLLAANFYNHPSEKNDHSRYNRNEWQNVYFHNAIRLVYIIGI